MTVHQALEHAWLKGDHSDRTHRIPSSRYDKIRAKIKARYVSTFRRPFCVKRSIRKKKAFMTVSEKGARKLVLESNLILEITVFKLIRHYSFSL